MNENCCAHYEIDSKTLEEWIACCMRKHGPSGDKTMTRAKCVRAAHEKFGKGRDFNDLIWISAMDSFVSVGETVEGDEEGRPPKKWWDACIRTLEKSGQGYTDEQQENICGALWYKKGIRKMLPG